MLVSKSSGIGGKWIDKKSLKTGDVVKLKSEAMEQPSQQGGTQLVAKMIVKGQVEPGNVAINKPSKNALINAFGEETKNWIDKELTLHVESGIFSGKRGVAVYIIPDGFELKEDSGGYLVIVPKGALIEEVEEDIDVADIPF